MKYINTPQLMAKYPTLTTGVILARNLDNLSGSADVDELLEGAEAKLRDHLRPDTISRHPHVTSWRAAYSSFGVKPSQYRSAGEALVRRVVKEGKIPRINKLVDLCNYVSIKYILPVAAYDLAQIRGDVAVGLAKGDEKFRPLFTEEVEHPNPGEVIYRDEEKALSRRWNWRVCHQARVTQETRGSLLTVEGLDLITREVVVASTTELARVIEELCGGEVKWAILDREKPEKEL